MEIDVVQMDKSNTNFKRFTCSNSDKVAFTTSGKVGFTGFLLFSRKWKEKTSLITLLRRGITTAGNTRSVP